MKLKIKEIDVDAGNPVIFVNSQTAKDLVIHAGDRIELRADSKRAVAVVDVINGVVGRGNIALSNELKSFFGLHGGKEIDAFTMAEPQSRKFISKKMGGKSLSRKEIFAIIKDISDNSLTHAEISYFILGVYENGMSFKETIYLTEAMYKTGHVLKWPSDWKVADKHCIGGIAGNRTTPIVVSICAAVGVKMPKTSSRAITSAAGTADTIESLAKVDFDIGKLQRIVKKTNACFVWGGSLGLAPADDKLIRVERLLNLDPESQLLASIMSKKLSAGSKYMVIDIPYGPGAKVSIKEGLHLKKKFLRIARKFNLSMSVILTDGSQPIGNGIGPTLEMIDVLNVLKRKNASKDLEEKSIMLAGELLELTGKAGKGEGKIMAKKILDSKKALRKFEQIINAQGRNKSGLRIAKYKKDVFSENQGKVHSINNKGINHLGRILGCPEDKGAGLYLHKKKHDFVMKGEKIITLYSESQDKLKEAVKACSKEKPFVFDN